MPSRRMLAFAAVSVAVAVVAGAAVAVVTSDPRTEAALIPLDGSPITDGDTAIATPSGSPTSTPTPTPSPTVAATTAPTAAPLPEPPSPSAIRSSGTRYVTDYGPRQPGGVTAPYRPGQTSWDVTSNGIRFRISMTAAKAGTPVTWTIATSSATSGCCAVYMLFGDGFGATPQMDCDHPDPTVSYTHTYNRGGRKEFMVQAGHDRSCGARGDGAVYGTFDVADGPSTAQGPGLPKVTFDSSTPVPGHEGDHRYVSLFGHVEEPDGFLTRLVVDFGDGTTREFPGDGNGCRRSVDGWPIHSTAWLPYEPPPYHRYAKPGTYTLTLTAYSAGCDGTQVQSGRASFRWTVPGDPSPTPTATPTPTPTATP